MFWTVHHTPSGPVLLPACQEAWDWLAKQKEKSEFRMMKPKSVRSVAQHRKCMAMLHRAHNNWPETLETQNFDDFVDTIKMFCGEYTIVLDFKGRPCARKVNSISFSSMDGDRFNKFFDTALALCARVIGCDEEDLLSEG